MHCLFLVLPLGRTHEQEGLAAVGAGTELGFDPVAHLQPIPPIGKMRGEPLQLALAGPNQIMSLAALQPGDVLGAGHAAVHHPHATRLAVAALYRGDDLLHGCDVGAIAGEHLIA